MKKKQHENNRRKALNRKGSAAVICLSGALFAQNTLAQEISEVIVTGSRITGVAPVGATVTTLTRDEIENSGQVTLDRMIQDLPQVIDVGFSENSRAQTAGNGNATWSNSINLRGLSPYGTLILTDGHRMTTNGRAISPSVLPTLGVERIEVIADGASAIYGSDAVAGVVNLIPRRSLDGVEAFVRGGATSGSDFNEWNGGVALGKIFDRGQVMLAYEHAFRSSLNGLDRDFTASDLSGKGGPDYRVNQCSPGTLIYQGQRYALPAEFTAANAGSLTAGTENLCDPLRAQDLFPEQEYDSFSTTATFALTPSIDLTLDGYYNERDFKRTANSITSTLTVPPTNAFFVAPSFYTGGTYQIGYNFEDESPTDPYRGYQTNWQITPGVQVQLPSDWKLEAKVGYGEAEDRAGQTANLSAAALNAALASSDPATAFDPYGLNRTTSATLSSLFEGESTFPTNAELTTWQVGFDGPVMDLPGGQVKAAVGYEGQDFTMILGAGTANVRTYDRTVDSAYAELHVPLVGPDNAMQGIADLELTAAVRYDRYDDVGSTNNPKFGLNWRPVEWLKLRASYGTSFRAPTFPEIFGNSTALYVQNHLNPAGGNALSVYKVGSGPNPDVGPETATTRTFGVDFEMIDGLRLGLTWFDVSYENTIAGLLSNLSILTYADEYAGTDVILYGQAAYDRIVDIRDNGIGGTPGPIQIITRGGASQSCLQAPAADFSNCIYADGRSLNLGRSEMDGIDFDIQYRTQIGRGDNLRFTLGGTYVTSYDVAFTPSGDFSDLLDNIYNPLSFKARGSVVWDRGPYSARATVQYVGGYTNDLVNPEESVSSYTLVDLNLSWQLTDTFNVEWAESMTLGFEILNLFDEDPPYVNSPAGLNSGGGYDPTVSNPIGREYALSLRSRF